MLLFTAMAVSLAVLIGLPGLPPLPPLGIWPKVVLSLWVVWRLWRFLAALPFATARSAEETAS
jgi:hypothetical protein